MASASFSLQVAEFVARAKVAPDLILRKLVLSIGTSLIMKSPVDTGRFRANWFFGLGAPSPEVQPELMDKTGGASLDRIAESLPMVQFGQVIWLSNNLPYARRLEYGWSKQAPEGMVRITVAEFQSYMREAVGR